MRRSNKLKQFMVETNTVGHTIKELLSGNGSTFNSKEV